MADKQENENLIVVPESTKKALKQKHGSKAKLIEIPTDDLYDQYMEVVVLVPNRSVVSQYMRFQKENPKKAQEILIKNCVLTSKEEILEDDGLFLTTVGMLAELIPVREGKFKKF